MYDHKYEEYILFRVLVSLAGEEVDTEVVTEVSPMARHGTNFIHQANFYFK